MLDLNLEAESETDDPGKITASEICGDDSGISVTASSCDEYSNSSSHHTLADGDGGNSLCTLNFSILKSDQVIVEAEEESNGDYLAVTEQIVPVAGKSLSPTAEAPPSRSWLNLSVLDSGCKPPWMPPPYHPVKKTRRGPRSRSSQYRGVTFYRRTGRWESHIWDCGKQIYLGGFDTAHFAARAYDRAALKFRGVDADINFHISDYEEYMKQIKNLTKEEFVQTLRRQSAGFSKRSSRYRGVTLHKCGRRDAHIGQFLGERTCDKADINQHKDVGGGDSHDPNHWISPPLGGGLKGPDNTRKMEFNYGVHEMPALKRVNVFVTNTYPSRFSHDSSYSAVDSSPATPCGPAMASKYSIWSGMHSGIIPNTREQRMGMRGEKTAAPAFSNWQWKMQRQGVVTSSVPAASSGFSSTTTPLRHP